MEYMSRMYGKWCKMLPENNSLTSKNLRDYVSYLWEMGYVRVPPLLNPPVAGKLVQQTERLQKSTARTERDPLEELEHHWVFHTCRGLYTTTDLQREGGIVHELLSEKAVIWYITTVVYDAVLRLSDSERVRNPPIDRVVYVRWRLKLFILHSQAHSSK